MTPQKALGLQVEKAGLDSRRTPNIR